MHQAPVEVKLKCQYEEKSCELNFKVLDQNLTPLMSDETCVKLELLTLNIDDTYKVETIENVFESFPDVIEGLGRLPGKYHTEIDPEVCPVPHSARNVPIALIADLALILNAEFWYLILNLKL